MDIGQIPNPFKDKNSARDMNDKNSNNSSLYGIGDYDEEPVQQQQQAPTKQEEKDIATQATEKVKEQVSKAADQVTGK
ncbi:hypothetical protein INT45_012926 [Circinella minor]|uniref:Uncharacterized protein n=1 Tax=Circinella minor TaxID=1195481 RepID=A0A8H7S6G8_9FUNG|nr:hypothetical protein INT45_012926 [Circinella minor]